MSVYECEFVCRGSVTVRVEAGSEHEAVRVAWQKLDVPPEVEWDLIEVEEVADESPEEVSRG